MTSFGDIVRSNNLRSELIENWRTSKRIAADATATENALRKQVIQMFSEHAGENDLESGVENVDLPGGSILKITHKLTYKLNTDNDGEKLTKALTAIAKSQEGGNVIAERLVKWKPELSVTEYKLLNGAQRKLIDAVLTTKPAAKSVEIKDN